MKVTEQLINWMTTQRRERGWSYSEMARRSGGLSWEFFRKIESGLVTDIRSKSEECTARVFGVTVDDLRAVAGGNRKVEHPPCDPDVRAAEALLRWVRKSTDRQAALKAMGYKGDL